ncbi:hypothetical protein [Vibrio coralliilyticus]|uniref:hypothetical protein n=1 Tax=Vibrio coralliilyticus TaxID=190893 RepID=UPI000C16D0D9|nr:hypothetical protein [Vibrio coralliilyticus]
MCEDNYKELWVVSKQNKHVTNWRKVNNKVLMTAVQGALQNNINRSAIFKNENLEETIKKIGATKIEGNDWLKIDVSVTEGTKLNIYKNSKNYLLVTMNEISPDIIKNEIDYANLSNNYRKIITKYKNTNNIEYDLWEIWAKALDGYKWCPIPYLDDTENSYVYSAIAAILIAETIRQPPSIFSTALALYAIAEAKKGEYTIENMLFSDDEYVYYNDKVVFRKLRLDKGEQILVKAEQAGFMQKEKIKTWIKEETKKDRKDHPLSVTDFKGGIHPMTQIGSSEHKVTDIDNLVYAKTLLLMCETLPSILPEGFTIKEPEAELINDKPNMKDKTTPTFKEAMLRTMASIRRHGLNMVD